LPESLKHKDLRGLYAACSKAASFIIARPKGTFWGLPLSVYDKCAAEMDFAQSIAETSAKIPLFLF